MKTVLELPVKAKEIWEELGELELNHANWWLYLSSCLGFAGYEHAADWAYQKSKDERGDYKSIVVFVAGRGVEMDVPATPEPKIPFVDLKNAIDQAISKEIEATEKYDECFKMMCEVDSLSYIELQGKLTHQRYVLEELMRIKAVFSGVESVED